MIWETTVERPLDFLEPLESSRNVEIHGAGDLVIVAWGWVYALDRRTGEIVWSLTPSEDRPGRWVVPAGDQLIGVGGRHLYVIDPASGDVLSTIDVGMTPFAPVHDEGVLYFGALATDGGISVEATAAAVAVSTGEVVWRVSLGDATQPSNLRGLHRGDLTDELFVIGGERRQVFGLSRATGEPIWVYRPDGPFYAGGLLSSDRPAVRHT